MDFGHLSQDIWQICHVHLNIQFYKNILKQNCSEVCFYSLINENVFGNASIFTIFSCIIEVKDKEIEGGGFVKITLLCRCFLLQQL